MRIETYGFQIFKNGRVLLIFLNLLIALILLREPSLPLSLQCDDSNADVQWI